MTFAGQRLAFFSYFSDSTQGDVNERMMTFDPDDLRHP